MQNMRRKISDYLLIGLRGMGMGAADVIPGVSGGTIAFITGIYEELIHSIKSINGNFFRILFREGVGSAWRHINATFLVAVLGGVLISIFSLARLISWLLANHEKLVWAFFFGLIIGSAVYIGRKIDRWNFLTIVMLLAGTAIAYYVTVATPATTPEALWFIFLSGSIAICAMILPGISGSFILLLLGKYEFMLNAVRDLRADVLAVFALGCAIGIVAFSNVISWFFKNFPNATLGVLSGFMIGSLNKLWPWKEVLETRISSTGEEVPFLEKSVSPGRYVELTGEDPLIFQVIFFALLGMAIIFVFEYIHWKKQKEKTG